MKIWQIVAIVLVIIFGIVFVGWMLHNIKMTNIKSQVYPNLYNDAWLNANGECISNMNGKCCVWKFGESNVSYGILYKC